MLLLGIRNICYLLSFIVHRFYAEFCFTLLLSQANCALLMFDFVISLFAVVKCFFFLLFEYLASLLPKSYMSFSAFEMFVILPFSLLY